jgi:hypothetical protein
MILEDYKSFISVNIGLHRITGKSIFFLNHKKTSKINDFGGLLKLDGLYEPIYEPFFAGFEENCD